MHPISLKAGKAHCINYDELPTHIKRLARHVSYRGCGHVRGHRGDVYGRRFRLAQGEIEKRGEDKLLVQQVNYQVRLVRGCAVYQRRDRYLDTLRLGAVQPNDNALCAAGVYPRGHHIVHRRDLVDEGKGRRKDPQQRQPCD